MAVFLFRGSAPFESGLDCDWAALTSENRFPDPERRMPEPERWPTMHDDDPGAALG